MSGATGALAFDLSHPRDTPSQGVPALVALLEGAEPADSRVTTRVLPVQPHAHSPVRRVGAALARLAGLDRSARVIAWLIAACMGLGLVMIYSTSAIAAERDPRIADALFFLRRQSVAIGVGLAAMVLLGSLSMRRWQWLAHKGIWLSAAALAAVFVPGIGYAANGARRWVRLPGLGFQPSDFARVGLVAFLAWCAARHAAGDRRARWAAVIAIGALVGLIAVEPDIGTAATTAGVALLLVWLGGLFSLKRLALVGAIALPLAAVTAYSAFPHVRKRVHAFTGSEAEGTRGPGSHQLRQGLIAFGAGGPAGVGLGAGRQKLQYLPEESTDFILAEVGEELGFVGTMTVLLLFAALCLHGCAVSFRARTTFAAMLAAGATLLITTQAAANVAVVTGLIPTTGIPLPFISYGGSGTVALACAAGALVAVARAVDRDAEWSCEFLAPSSPDDTVDLPAEPAPGTAERDPRPTERLEMADILDPLPRETIVAPDLLADICGSVPETDGIDLHEDSEPAIELERGAVIRETEYRELNELLELDDLPPKDGDA